MDRVRKRFGQALETIPDERLREAVERLRGDSLIGDEDLARAYAVLVLTTGVKTTVDDVHAARSVWIDAKMPGHRSLVPRDQLSDADLETLHEELYAKTVVRVAIDMERDNVENEVRIQLAGDLDVTAVHYRRDGDHETVTVVLAERSTRDDVEAARTLIARFFDFSTVVVARAA
jgi:hypothetical protein